jgi:hypothetical protein
MVVHTPPLQKFEAQATRQRPQFSGLPTVAVSQPLLASPSHSAKPSGQRPFPQTPFQHSPPASHARPHAPQLAMSVNVLRQAPPQHDHP